MSWGGPKYNSDEQRDINEGLRERGYYPGAPYPFDVFVIESLGLDPTKFPHGERFIYKNGYYTMKPDPNGYDWVNNKWHPWTEEQQDIIDKHWRLISNGVKSSYSTGGYVTGTYTTGVNEMLIQWQGQPYGSGYSITIKD